MILYAVDDVLNAVYVEGNCLGPAMFYGSGAGSLPTASAVVSDILDCAQNLHTTVKKDITDELLPLLPLDDVKNTFFVRAKEEAKVKAQFGEVEMIRVNDDEFGFWTKEMTEKEFKEKAKAAAIISFLRRG